MFYPRYAWEIPSKAARFAALWLDVPPDPQAGRGRSRGRDYRDLALTPVTEGEIDDLEIFRATKSARQAVVKARLQKAQQRPPRPVRAAEDAA